MSKGTALDELGWRPNAVRIYSRCGTRPRRDRRTSADEAIVYGVTGEAVFDGLRGAGSEDDE